MDLPQVKEDSPQFGAGKYEGMELPDKQENKRLFR